MPHNFRGLVNISQRYLFLMLVCFQLLQQTLSSSPVCETLMVIRDLGIQTCTKTISSGEIKRFHDISRIRDFIINDHVTFYYVRQYCAFLVENEKELVVPFKNCTKLRQLDLEYIYCSVRQILS